ncbi:hypothetical protein C8F01DRAFT_1368369, partial [Mycena amicta]
RFLFSFLRPSRHSPSLSASHRRFPAPLHELPFVLRASLAPSPAPTTPQVFTVLPLHCCLARARATLSCLSLGFPAPCRPPAHGRTF